jgi:hypothetical protein
MQGLVVTAKKAEAAMKINWATRMVNGTVPSVRFSKRQWQLTIQGDQFVRVDLVCGLDKE